MVVVLFTRLLFPSVPLLLFQTFQTPFSAFHKKFMSKDLRDFRLGTVASNDHETPLTFGVASYYWSRVSSALGRLSQYLAADSAHTWHVVVADDYHLAAGGEHYRFALFAFFLLCCTCGVPLSWNKTADGETVVWEGGGFAQHPPLGHFSATGTMVHKVSHKSG